MTTFLMMMLTLLTVLGGVILGWLARCYWLGGNCCEMMASYEADGGVGRTGLGGGAIGTVAAGTAAMRSGESGDTVNARSGIADVDESDSKSGIGGIAAGAIGTVAAGAAAVRSAGGKAVAAGTDAAKAAGEKVAGAASDARASLSGSGDDANTESDTDSSDASDPKGGISGLAASAAGSVAAGAAAVRSAGGKAVAAGTDAAKAAGGKVAGAASDARSSLSGSGDNASDGQNVGTAGSSTDQSGNPASGSTAATSGGDSGVTASSNTTSSGDSGTSGSTARSNFAGVGEDKKQTDSAAHSSAGASSSSAADSGVAGSSDSAARKDGATPSAGTASASAAAAQGSAANQGSTAGSNGDSVPGATEASATGGQSGSAGQSSAPGDKAGSADSNANRTAGSGTGQTAQPASGSAASASAASGGTASAGSGAASAASNATASSSGTSATAAAGIGGAALAGAAATSGSAASSSDATSEELEASRAEVRGLRKRLGLSGDSDGSDLGDQSVDAKLGASREQARTLRQELWSKEQSDNAKGGADSNASSASDSEFGELGAEEAEAQRLIASGTVAKAPSNAMAEPTPGFGPDDLTKIRGIGKPTQGRLNRNGIYYYDQIAGFTAADLAWADTEMNLEGRVVSDRWIPQAKLLAGESAGNDGDSGGGDDAAAFANIPTALSAEEAEAERLLASGEEIAPPASRLEAPRSGQSPDDLTRIKGIGPKINSKLNDQGIYYYDQIAGFTGSDLAWADRELEFKGRAVRDRWIPQAQGLMNTAAASGNEPTVAAPAGLLTKPLEGRDPDDLTAIKGVGDVLQKQLNDKGIYYYQQIAEFTDSDQEWANQTLGFPGRVERDNWIPQARELMTSPVIAGGSAARAGLLADAGRDLDNIEEGDDLGAMLADEADAMRLIESGDFVADESNRPDELLSSASQGPKDDLQQIKGVGPKLEDLLNTLGIYYFRQVAGFSASDIAWVDSKLRFKGRIVRDRWVVQAKRLS